MFRKTAGNTAAWLCLMWLCFHAFSIWAPRWASFLGLVACALPMLLAAPRLGVRSFGTRDCNTMRYPKRAYAAFFVCTISGNALLAALPRLFAGATLETTVVRHDFFYLLVFSCMIPAVFEEWFVRGGVLGAVADRGGAGILLCALAFMLMHTSLSAWPYAFFGGLMLTLLVYLTECVYLGMLLHFCNNFASLLLSYLPTGAASYAALAALALTFAASLYAFRRSDLYVDARKVMQGKTLRDDLRALCTPWWWVFALLCIILSIL